MTRPGIAAIASALLVEMFVSVLQHPQRAFAPAPASPNEDRGEHPLGVVPHQVRGFLSNFQNLVIKGNSYDCCSACSPQIIDAYKADGWHFVKRALNEKGYVEELSGLAEVRSPVIRLFPLFRHPLLTFRRYTARQRRLSPKLKSVMKTMQYMMTGNPRSSRFSARLLSTIELRS